MHFPVVTGKWHHFSPVLPWSPTGSGGTALAARSWPTGNLTVLVPWSQDAAVPHCAPKALIAPVTFLIQTHPNHPFRSHSYRVICPCPLFSHPQRAPPHLPVSLSFWNVHVENVWKRQYWRYLCWFNPSHIVIPQVEVSRVGSSSFRHFSSCRCFSITSGTIAAKQQEASLVSLNGAVCVPLWRISQHDSENMNMF